MRRNALDMITGAIEGQVDQMWNASWSGGIFNPLEVMEQITYRLFPRRLAGLYMLEENKPAQLETPMARRLSPEGMDAFIDCEADGSRVVSFKRFRGSDRDPPRSGS